MNQPMTPPNLCARAAAELEGWRWVIHGAPPPNSALKLSRCLESPETIQAINGHYRDPGVRPADGSEPIGQGISTLPSYPADLNAVRRLEMKLEERGKAIEYVVAIQRLIISPLVFEEITAPAAVRFAAVCAVCGWSE